MTRAYSRTSNSHFESSESQFRLQAKALQPKHSRFGDRGSIRKVLHPSACQLLSRVFVACFAILFSLSFGMQQDSHASATRSSFQKSSWVQARIQKQIQTDESRRNVREAFRNADKFPWYEEKSDEWNPDEIRSTLNKQDAKNASQLRDSEWLKQKPKPKPKKTRNVGTGGWSSIFQTLATVLFWLIVALIFAGVIGFLLWAFLRNDLSHSKDDLQDWLEAEDDRTDEERIEALPFELKTNQTDLLAMAKDAYAQGNHHQAMIYLYSHMLIRLDRAHLIRLAKGKTNRQYLDELGRRGTLRSVFERAMISFEDVFFGNHDLPKSEFEQAMSGLDEFHTLVDSQTQQT